MINNNNNPFIYIGPLNPKRDLLVCIDRKKQVGQILNGIKKQNYYFIIAPRGTGKTTFIYQLINRINNEFYPYESIYITLEDLNYEKKEVLYSHLSKKIINSLCCKYAIDPPSLLQRTEKIHNNQEFEDFLIELSKARFINKLQESPIITFEKEKKLKFVIFIEIIWMSKELAIEILRTIRSLCSKRADSQEFAYSFILSSSIDIVKLTERETALFTNIAERIDLEDFNEEEIFSMVQSALYSICIQYYESFLKELFMMTNGHPWLTQMICSKIINSLILNNRKYIKEEDLRVQIDNLLYFDNIIFRTTWNEVRDNKNIDIIKRILNGDKIKYNECDEFSYELKLTGAIVKDERGFCKIRNPLYGKFFTSQFNSY